MPTASRFVPATLVATLSAAFCVSAHAGSPAPFTEEAAARGVFYNYGFGPGAGHGICLADMDNDGDPDLVCVGTGSGSVGVHENDGTGVFLNRSAESGITPFSAVAGVIAADYDGDGDLDLHLSRWAAANVLLRNEGNFQFTDVTALAGLGDDGYGTGCAWGDYDNDGWLDLYVSNMSTFGPLRPNRLFRNRGDGTFVDVAPSLGVDDARQTWKAVFFDYDRDGDADLYLSTDKGAVTCPENHNELFRNDGGVFTNVTETSGTEACIDSMGVTVGDFDGNGWADIYATNTPSGNVLLANHGDGTFTSETESSNTGSYATGWSCNFFDYDNDAQLELYVCNEDSLNRMYDADGAWPCQDDASALGVQKQPGARSHCSAVADLDNDGDLDLVVQTQLDALDIFINHEGDSRHAVKLRVVGEWPNTHAVGALVTVRAGPYDQFREVQSGTNFKSQNDYVLHYGLNDQEMLDLIVVSWPNGPTRILTGLPADETWTLYPPSRLGDADNDEDLDLDDFVALVNCLTGPGPGALVPGCEVMDIDGDSDVDYADFNLFLSGYSGPHDDCNGNGLLDLIEIIDDPSRDGDGDGRLDACDVSCPADVNGDTIVNVNDLVAIILGWGPCPVACPADVNESGAVSVDDLVEVVIAWGPCE